VLEIIQRNFSERLVGTNEAAIKSAEEINELIERRVINARIELLEGLVGSFSDGVPMFKKGEWTMSITSETIIIVEVMNRLIKEMEE
jgi:hypothetical protein